MKTIIGSAAVALFLETVSKLAPTEAPLVRAAVERASADLERLLDDQARDEILARAAFRLAAARWPEPAERICASIRDDAQRERCTFQLSLFERYFAIADLTPAEKALFTRNDEPGIAALVIESTRSGSIDDLISGAVSYMNEIHPRYQLIERTAYLLPPVLARWGAGAAVAIIDSIADFDHRLVAAADRVAESSRAE